MKNANSICQFTVTLNLFQGLTSETLESKMLKQVQHDAFGYKGCAT